MQFTLFLLTLVGIHLSASAAPTPDHVFLLVGQSNMAGRAALEEGDDAEIEGALLWNGESWEAAKPGLNRYSTHRKEKFTQGINPGVGFITAYREANPDTTIGIICCARGGTSIRNWHLESNKMPLLPEAIKQTKAALANGGTLIGILWHQGESDSSSSENYPDKLAELIATFRTELAIPNAPFVFSQLGQWKDDYSAFNKMILPLPKEIPNTACVTTEDLTSYDNTHFDRVSQLELGKRFAAAMLKLTQE